MEFEVEQKGPGWNGEVGKDRKAEVRKGKETTRIGKEKDIKGERKETLR